MKNFFDLTYCALVFILSEFTHFPVFLLWIGLQLFDKSHLILYRLPHPFTMLSQDQGDFSF